MKLTWYLIALIGIISFTTVSAITVEDLQKTTRAGWCHNLVGANAETVEAAIAEVLPVAAEAKMTSYLLAPATMRTVLWSKANPDKLFPEVMEQYNKEIEKLGVTNYKNDLFYVTMRLAMFNPWYYGTGEINAAQKSAVTYNLPNVEKLMNCEQDELAKLMVKFGYPEEEWVKVFDMSKNYCAAAEECFKYGTEKTGAEQFIKAGLSGKLDPKNVNDLFYKTIGYELSRNDLDPVELKSALLRIKMIYTTKARQYTGDGVNPWLTFLGSLQDNISILNEMSK